MVNTNNVAEIGFLIGEPARAAILMALMGGQALTATELAHAAGVTPQTASSHLTRLAAAHLIEVDRQGRHRYHRLASPDVARMIEGIMQLSTDGMPAPRKVVTGPRDEAMRNARTCYDHFAGRLGVAIADALSAKGAIHLDHDAGVLTEDGATFLGELGLQLPPVKPSSRRPVCRPCLDWSERRPHIAGRLGQAIFLHFMERTYVRRIRESRALEITPDGRAALRDMFGIRDF